MVSSVGVAWSPEGDRGSQFADNRIRRRCVLRAVLPSRRSRRPAARRFRPRPLPRFPRARAGRDDGADALEPGDRRQARVRPALRHGRRGAARLAAARAREDAPKADEVVFLGAPGSGRRDRRGVVRRKTSVDVRVPLGAVPGRWRSWTRDGRAVRAFGRRRWRSSRPPPRGRRCGRRTRPRAYYDAAKPATLTYVVHGAAPVAGDRRRWRARSTASWSRTGTCGAVAPEVAAALTWDGLAGGKVQRDRASTRSGSRRGGVRAGARVAFEIRAATASRFSARTRSAPARRRSAAGAATRARTCSPRAGRRWSPRTAAS